MYVESNHAPFGPAQLTPHQLSSLVTSLEHRIARMDDRVRVLEGRPSIKEEEEQDAMELAAKQAANWRPTGMAEMEAAIQATNDYLASCGLTQDSDPDLIRIAMAIRELPQKDKTIVASLACSIANRVVDGSPSFEDIQAVWPELSPNVREALLNDTRNRVTVYRHSPVLT